MSSDIPALGIRKRTWLLCCIAAAVLSLMPMLVEALPFYDWGYFINYALYYIGISAACIFPCFAYIGQRRLANTLFLWPLAGFFGYLFARNGIGYVDVLVVSYIAGGILIPLLALVWYWNEKPTVLSMGLVGVSILCLLAAAIDLLGHRYITLLTFLDRSFRFVPLSALYAFMGCKELSHASKKKARHRMIGTRSKATAALLAFFLGSFGAHRFYLGYKTQGMIQLFGFIGMVMSVSPLSADLSKSPASMQWYVAAALLVLGVCTRLWASVDFLGILFGWLYPADEADYAQRRTL